MLSTGRSPTAIATRSIFPTTAHPLWAAGGGGGAAVYVARLSCITSRSRRRLMSLCVSNALSLFTVPSTRHDVQHRAWASHRVLLYHYLPLFTSLTLHIKHIKVTLNLGLPRPASEKMLRWCQR